MGIWRSHADPERDGLPADGGGARHLDTIDILTVNQFRRGESRSGMRHGARRLRIPAILAMTGLALLAAGCSTGSGSAPPAGSPPLTEDVSLTPAKVSAEPAAVPSALVEPSIALPSGDPGAPPSPPSDYQNEPDDFAGFAAAYRAAFSGVQLTDEQVRAAGSALCTYLMRHADGGGTVDLEEALIEADISQPGFARSDWLTALEIANEHYCGSFSVDFEGAAG